MKSFTFLLLIIVVFLTPENVRAQSKPVLINCGSDSSTDVDGRTWVGDSHPVGSNFTLTLPGAIAPAPENDGDEVYRNLYKTARVFNVTSSYKFGIAAGSYFLRLHFSQLFTNLSANESVFDVTANGLKLLSKCNVPGEIYWRNSKINSTSNIIVKEYLLNVTSGKLEVEFAPDAGSFAFTNAMEVVPVPGNSIFDSVNKVGGIELKGPFRLEGSGIETMYRVCVGGGKIERKEDPRLWRKWDPDEHFIFSLNAAHAIANSSNISYVPSDDSTSAPLRLYETARVTTENFVMDKKFNVSWRFNIDPDFDYLVRLHFCELEYDKAEQRKFKIYINSKTAAENYDVFARAGGKNKAFHEDFLDAASSQTDTLWVQLGSESSSAGSAASDALLNGMEIFKVSRDGNLGHPTMRIGVIGGGTVKPKRSPKWVLIGAAVGLVISISIAGGVYICFYLRQKKNTSANKAKDSPPGWRPLALHGATAMATNARSSPILHTTGTFGSCRMGRQFSIAEIRTATMNFDESLVIGMGGFGKVYKGEMEDGTLVAIKRGHTQSQQGVKEFETEIEMLSRLRHRHLVPLIGYCDEQNEMILVYEHMANGTLRSHLYGSDLPALTWNQRLEICIGAARGLHYLHTGLERGIIHRDVKTTNILLDGSFVVKMADFGISKDGPPLDHTHVSTAVKGSFGYLDPEYFRRQQLTQSSDVYSFGVVLFEVLCARPVINPTLPRDQINLADWALKWKRQNLLETIIDSRLYGNYTTESVKQFSEIAEKCLVDEGRSRPSMGEVLWNLESALQLHQAHLQSATANDLSGRELQLSAASTNIGFIEEVEESAHADCQDADDETVDVKIEEPC
ncbi:probable receptor-like protein kinase At1g30570 [Phragmites australis]|uniref:probable receptor-like protein kinase At1g30570 n=1 Tax=Phragmites australis TaxID=29695 RepID=UPI002D7A290C|nr:probable receptor-like protein kinase At1g30570 [Phragmites australis]XP_062188307.1 probable receptor-like protein kinase At1g30570 [Phragmites australis]XP_062188308.1 probable receptor-like protein kinase At1g30570 [Phragmites australis]